MNVRSGLLAGLLALVSVSVHAEVYRSVDAQGNVTYSDEPTKNAKVVNVKPVTTITLPKPETVSEVLQSPPPRGDAPAAYKRVSFSAPNDQDAFHSGSGDVEFVVSSDPALRPGHKYEVQLDGQPVGQSTTGSVTVRNVYRGTHRADVHIVDRQGLRVMSGDSISFTVHRPTVNN
ncbi:DUF4124 domain-containing protein [Marinobacter sp. X15-166B]|uniref:DUF4124 domain-containing protein n=1 Tax=Marinobacter sp. X15-166B TaxID=1897620 RepID=UPI00085C25F3|nr:DUF4124 domain-containing protein [Marinobacter sp. X15-166B]OEY66580.1 hypothetical protein BG841_09010 [Marinobacter sp. X15-166B]